MYYLDKATLLLLLQIYFGHEQRLTLPSLKYLYPNDFIKALKELNVLHKYCKIKLVFYLEEYESLPENEKINFLYNREQELLNNTCKEHYVDILNRNIEQEVDLYSGFNSKFIDKDISVDEYALSEIQIQLYIDEESRTNIKSYLDDYIYNYRWGQLIGAENHRFDSRLQKIKEIFDNIFNQDRYETGHIQIPVHGFIEQSSYKLLEMLYYFHFRNYININFLNIDYQSIGNSIINFIPNIIDVDRIIGIESQWYFFEGIETNTQTGETYYKGGQIKFQSTSTNEYKLLKILIEQPDKKVGVKQVIDFVFSDYPDTDEAKKNILKDNTIKDLHKKFRPNKDFTVSIVGDFVILKIKSP